LTATTQKANHLGKWETFEDAVKEAITNNEEVEEDTEFEADVSYPGSDTVYWKRSTGATVETDDADYPDEVDATLTVDGEEKASVNLSGADEGLYPPTYFKTVPYWKKYSEAEREDDDEDETGVVW
jgi:hypothetical protein